MCLPTESFGPVIEIILPPLLTNFNHEEWPYREAAVFTLGSVTESYTEVVVPHLLGPVPYLITYSMHSAWGRNGTVC
jgi:hypothetical protein